MSIFFVRAPPAPFQFNLSSEEWKFVFELDNVEKVAKLFHLMNHEQKTWCFEGAAENDCFKIVNFIFANMSFTSYEMDYAIRRAIRKFSKSLRMINLLVKMNEAFESSNFTLFLYSVEIGKLDVVKFFVEEKKMSLEEQSVTGECALLIACNQKKFDVVKYLVSKGSSLHSFDRFLQTPLFCATTGGSLEIVKYIASLSVSLDVVNASGENLVYAASCRGFLDIVNFFVEKKVDLNLQNDFGKTPLASACANGHLKVVEYLVANGAKVNLANKEMQTPLFAATSFGKLEIVKFLVEIPEVDINKCNINSKTPLFIATSQGFIDIVKLLISKGARVNQRDFKGDNALKIAMDYGYWDIVKILKAASGIE